MTEPGLDDSARRPRRVAGTLAVVLGVLALAAVVTDAVSPGDLVSVPSVVRGPGSGLQISEEAAPAAPDGEPGEVALPDPVVDPAWTRLPEAPLLPRDEHTLVWTGTEAITWGGLGPAYTATGQSPGPNLPALFDGAAYDPARDRWRLIALAPIGFDARTGHVAVWTGREMLLWGGRDADNLSRGDGAAYDPATDTWRSLSNSPLVARSAHSGVWTGTEMVIWGGVNRAHYFDGGAYDPATDTWRRLAPSPLRGRQGQQAVWTGEEVVIWGGTDAAGGFDPQPAGAAYDPETDTWRVLPPAPVAGRLDHTVTWAGDRMLVWGGMGEQAGQPVVHGDGAAYDPVADTWTVLPQAPLAPRFGHSAVSTGDRLLIWGGVADRFFRAGASYDVASGTWSEIGTGPIDYAARYPAVWTGRALLVWGGNPHAEGAAWGGLGQGPPPVAQPARLGPVGSGDPVDPVDPWARGGPPRWDRPPAG